MVMPRIKDRKTLAAAGAEMEEGRRPAIVSTPAAALPELLHRPRRCTFTAQDKLRILGAADRAAGGAGGIGAIVRSEGLYLPDWRRRRAAGAFEALSSAKRGPKTVEPNPLAAELAQSLRDNLRLKQRLERAETIIELQKKLQHCWASQRRATEGLDGRRGGSGAGQQRDHCHLPSVKEAKADRKPERGIHRKLETSDHPREYVDGKRQPWPLERNARFFMDDDQIDEGVIDLNHFERPRGLLLVRNRSRRLDCGNVLPCTP